MYGSGLNTRRTLLSNIKNKIISSRTVTDSRWVSCGEWSDEQHQSRKTVDLSYKTRRIRQITANESTHFRLKEAVHFMTVYIVLNVLTCNSAIGSSQRHIIITVLTKIIRQRLLFLPRIDAPYAAIMPSSEIRLFTHCDLDSICSEIQRVQAFI